MPSTGEGFGVVFIEALHYGLPVVAGNADGSVDALAGGKFGVLVNPADAAQLLSAVEEVLRDPNRYVPADRTVWSTFGFPAYKVALSRVVFKTAGGPSQPGAAPAT
jgi:glycosyltransferase involved in cell wall biosynthesis